MRRAGVAPLLSAAITSVAGCDLLGSRASRSPVPSPTADEAYLLSGIRSDAASDCVPVRSALPAGAVGAVECSPNEGAVERVRLTLFTFPDDLRALYFAEMTAHGVALNSGGCVNGNGEST